MQVLAPLLQAAVFAGVPLATYALLAHEPLSAPHEVARGVLYSVEALATDAHGRGRLYLARIRLDPAALDLFITPPDPAADGISWTHRLAHAAAAAKTERLAVSINGSTFAGGSYPVRRAGERARTVETTVVNGRVVSLWEHSYLLGFTPDLTPEPVMKPPPRDKLPSWKWAVGAQSWAAGNGAFNPGTGEGDIDVRTYIGINPDRRELYLAVFDHASYGRGARELLARGAAWATHLDGGDSSTFALQGRAVFGGWRPVANQIGIRLR